MIHPPVMFRRCRDPGVSSATWWEALSLSHPTVISRKVRLCALPLSQKIWELISLQRSTQIFLAFTAWLVVLGIQGHSAHALAGSDCTSRNLASAEDLIRSCSTLIEEPHPDEAILAMALIRRGMAYISKQDLSLGAADLEKSTNISRNADVLIALGNIYNAEGKYDLALDRFTQGIYLRPGRASDYNLRGGAYENLRRLDEAIKDFDHATRIEPAFAVAYNNRANAFRMEGKLDRSLQDIDMALKIDPSMTAASLNRCVILAAENKFSVGKADCDKALQAQPNSLPVLTSVGCAYLIAGQFGESISYFDLALKIDPHHARSLYGRGLAKIRGGEAAAGKADVAEAERIQPDVAQWMKTAGVT